MTSSDKLNQNSTEKKEKNSDAPTLKNASPNTGMMGATAVLAAANTAVAPIIPELGEEFLEFGASLFFSFFSSEF